MTKKTSKPIRPDDPRDAPPEAEWPNSVRTRAELDDALETGSNSGASARTVADILAKVLARRKNAKL